MRKQHKQPGLKSPAPKPPHETDDAQRQADAELIDELIESPAGELDHAGLDAELIDDSRDVSKRGDKPSTQARSRSK